MKQQERNKTLLVALIALLAVGLALAIQVQEYRISRQSVYGDAVDSAVRTLRLERARLQAEMNQLEAQANQQKLGDGVAILVFTQLEERIYTEIFPLMQEKSMPGVLALSDTQFPGLEGCLTVEQAQQLLDSGWSLCVQWDDWSDLETAMDTLRGLLDEAGWEMPAAVYLAPNRYRSELDEPLRAQGFTILLCHGEEGTDTINRRDEEALWRLVSLSWNRAGIRKIINQVAALGGVTAMNVDFGQRRSGYNEEIFPLTLNALEQLPTLRVLTPEDARVYRSTVGENEALEAELEWYRGEIAEINREIARIYEDN